MLPIWQSRFKNHFLYFITIFFYFKQYILANIIIVLLFPIAAICRPTWREEAIIYVLHSFKCYLYANLDLIIIVFTLLQNNYSKRYSLANSIIVLLLSLAAICRSTRRKEAIIYVLHSFKCYLTFKVNYCIICVWLCLFVCKFNAYKDTPSQSNGLRMFQEIDYYYAGVHKTDNK